MCSTPCSAQPHIYTVGSRSPTALSPSPAPSATLLLVLVVFLGLMSSPIFLSSIVISVGGPCWVVSAMWPPVRMLVALCVRVCMERRENNGATGELRQALWKGRGNRQLGYPNPNPIQSLQKKMRSIFFLARPAAAAHHLPTR
jgi:hypothetical protein